MDHHGDHHGGDHGGDRGGDRGDHHGGGHGGRRGGHRSVPHTADLRIEAWGATREECLAQAVRGVCASFLDLGETARVRVREVLVPGDSDEDLLVGLLEEVVYRLDTEGEVPVTADLAPAEGGLRVRLHMADAGAFPLTGAVPKAVTLHELDITGGARGWTCSVTLDV